MNRNAVVAERQTRYFEGVVGEIPYGFKSHRPHQLVDADVVLRHNVFFVVKTYLKEELLKALIALSGAFVFYNYYLPMTLLT